MRKKIQIGCILAFIMLVLMPAIPAISFKTIEKEKIEKIDKEQTINDIPYKTPDKFPMLFYFVLAIGYFRIFRIYLLYKYSIKEGEYPGDFEVVRPLLFIRLFILLWTTDWWLEGWHSISDHFGWGWFRYK